MSEDQEKMSEQEKMGEREKLSEPDVEGHKLAGRMGEADDKRETDDDADVEGHIISPKHLDPKMDT